MNTDAEANIDNLGGNNILLTFQILYRVFSSFPDVTFYCTAMVSCRFMVFFPYHTIDKLQDCLMQKYLKKLEEQAKKFK